MSDSNTTLSQSFSGIVTYFRALQQNSQPMCFNDHICSVAGKDTLPPPKGHIQQLLL